MAERRLKRSLRVTFLGMFTNALLSTGKIVAGVLGTSHALVADGVESLADVMSSFIVWRGITVAAVPADAEHPYGHGKAEPLATVFVSAILLMAALWIVFGAAEDIVSPHDSPAPYTLFVLLLVVLIKEALFRFAMREGMNVESSVVKADAWHHRSDAITSIFAFIGISIALIGGPGWQAADDYAAILAGGIIAWNGWRLLRPAMDELMDIAPDPRLCRRVTNIAREVPKVSGVEKCLGRKMGNEFFIDMHIEVDPKMTVQESHDVAHNVKNAVRQEIPAIRDVLVHIEPERERNR
jgi:cation diffusion facilitator family transporter